MESIDFQILSAFSAGVILLLVFILFFKLNAFMSLLMASIAVGLFAGMPFTSIIDTVIKGMGGTLGFVAIVIGLGAIFGEILRKSGSTEILADKLLTVFGSRNAPIALSMAGFLIAIPVFFDVAFIILVPILYGLQKKTGKSLLYFAIPLLASLAVTHAFIPPTPGPIAVADILDVDLGWVILFGFIVGLPTTIVAGLMYGRFISRRIFVEVPTLNSTEDTVKQKVQPAFIIILFLIITPIFLIILNTLSKAIYPNSESLLIQILQFLGHPIVALLITCLLSMMYASKYLGFTKIDIQELSIKALGPAGIIILITGAGGVFKQILTETGAGEMLAEQFSKLQLTPIIMAFVLALIIRLIQGSATVAMITAAGIMSGIITGMEINGMEKALMVLSIAAGSSGFSHVNDSGFWLVNRYLGISEADTLKSWTMMTGVLSLTAFGIILLINLFV